MLTSYSASYKTWIFAKNGPIENMPVGRLLDFVINPETGIFEGIWIKTGKITGILSPKDVLSWNDEGIFISQENEISLPDKFPKIKKVLEKEVPILGNSVFVEKKKQLVGKVSDFSFDTISPRILSLHINSGFWLFGKQRIIGKKQIKKIKEEGIFITEPSIKIKEGGRVKSSVNKKLKSSLDIVEKSIKK